MGFVSYQEDDFERLEEGLEKLRQRLPAMEAQQPSDALAFRVYFGQMERMLKEIRGLLDLATDPTIELARDLAAARKRFERAERSASAAEGLLNQERATAGVERDRATRALAGERTARQQVEQRCHQLQRDRARLQQEVDRLTRYRRKLGR